MTNRDIKIEKKSKKRAEKRAKRILAHHNKSEHIELNRKKVVFLVHGLGRTRASMIIPQALLKKLGYTVYNFKYASTRHTVDEHGTSFADFIERVEANHKGAELNFVTHSLGGIVTRVAVDKVISRERDDINFGKAVLFAPPNQGAELADKLEKIEILNRVLIPLKEISSAPDSKIHSIPTPDVLDYGIIAGKYDGKVSPKMAKLGKERDFIVLPTVHTFIMDTPKGLHYMENFLQDGKFK